MNWAEPSWDHYRTLRAILEEGSLSGAARALGLTQPTVARHVDQLEAVLGRRLFVRTQRGLSPTEAALEIRPYAEAMSAASAALLRAATADRQSVTGTVRVTASEVVGVERLPPVLAELRGRYPGLVIELVVSNAVEDLLRRDADIAVRMVDLVQEALVARRVGRVELGLHATRAYLRRRGTPRTASDLAGFDVIGYDRETPTIRAMRRRYPELVLKDFALRADSDLAQLAAIRAGFGIGICQVGLAGNGGLERVLADAFAVELPTWVVMHEDLRSSPRCRAVFDALVAALSAQLG